MAHPQRNRQRRRTRDRCSGCADLPDCDCLDCSPFLLSMPMLWRVLLGALRTAVPEARVGSFGQRAAARLLESYRRNVAEQRTTFRCHMTPSCSRYASQAFAQYGVLRGGWLTVCRLRRCGRPRGHDPLP